MTYDSIIALLRHGYLADSLEAQDKTFAEHKQISNREFDILIKELESEIRSDEYKRTYIKAFKDAEEIARWRHEDMMCCMKQDDCHTIAHGALLAAEDIKYSYMDIEKEIK